MKKDIVIMVVSILLYVLNNIAKGIYSHEYISWFMNCYFNDIVGSMGFIAYCNILLSTQGLKLNKLYIIIIVLLCCGCVWEFLAPLIRSDTYCDLWDFVAYVLGGIIYYYISFKTQKRVND